MRTLLLACPLALVLLAACQSAAGQGATKGAVYGAAGSALVSAVFGGDVGEAAARGAVAGAAVGGIAGAVEDSSREKQAQEREEQKDLQQKNRELELRNRELELERTLIEMIGPDNTRALGELVECRRDAAFTHALQAADSDDENFRLASVYLEAMIELDARKVQAARDAYMRIAETDPDVANAAAAERAVLDLVTKLEDTRAEFGLPRRCP